MSSQTKFLISALFIVAIILCVGLTKFYLDASKNSGITNDDGEVSSIIRNCSNGMQIFEGANGFCGILDKNGSILVEPEWVEILLVSDKMAVVSKRFNGQLLIGGIDYEENVILPFAYRSIEAAGDSYYIATAAKDGSCVIYTTDFSPVFRQGWDSAVYNNGMLELIRDACTFSYYIAEGTPFFRRAQMQCDIGTETLHWNIANKTYLSELSPEDLIQINRCVAVYMDMLLENEFQDLEEIASPESIVGLSLHDSFTGYDLVQLKEFSFSYAASDVRTYDFAFSVLCRANGQKMDSADSEFPDEQNVRINLYFQKNASNVFILTSAGMDYQGGDISVSLPAKEE